MAIKRIYPTKDATISNYLVDGKWRATGSNFGFSEMLDVFKQVEEASGILPSWGRVLMKFSSSVFDETYVSGSYYLVMNHVQTADPTPTSFDLLAYPVELSWDEGTGLHDDTYEDKGFVNWEYRTSTLQWTATGSDYNNSMSGSMHFDYGWENLEIDITDIAIAWKSGSLTNEGLLLRLTDDEENNGNDYYIKKFFSRHTHYLDKRPYIELRYYDSYKDNRGNFKFDLTGSLILYNENNGIPGPIPDVGTITVTVSNTGSAYTKSFGNATYIGNGMYMVNGAIPYSDLYSGSGFVDYWNDGANCYLTGSFPVVRKSYGSAGSGTKWMHRSEHKLLYKNTDIDRVRVKFYRPSLYATSVVSSSHFDASWLTYAERAYYSVYDYSQHTTIIPRGDFTEMSYDISGNYFYFDFSSLVTGSLYGFSYYVDEGRGINLIGRSDRFKVE